MSAEIADVLDDAADYIEKHGLARGTAHDGDRRCTLAAINRAAEDREVYGARPHGSAFLALRRAVFGGDDIWDSLVDWSDNSPNDQVVLDTFRAAAKAQRRLDDAR